MTTASTSQYLLDRSVATLLESLAAYDAALRAMDRDGEIGINTDVHEVLRGLSEGHGAVYKISGAGGGDYGIALSDSREVIDTLSAALLDGGYSVLDGSIDVDGLTIVDEVR